MQEAADDSAPKVTLSGSIVEVEIALPFATCDLNSLKSLKPFYSTW